MDYDVSGKEVCAPLGHDEEVFWLYQESAAVKELKNAPCLE
jgi:hypothetical protein